MAFDVLGRTNEIMRRDLRDPAYNAKDVNAPPPERAINFTGNPLIDGPLNRQKEIANIDYANAVEGSRERRRQSLRRLARAGAITLGVGAAVAFGPDILYGIFSGKSPGDAFGSTIGFIKDQLENLSKEPKVGETLQEIAKPKPNLPTSTGGRLFDVPGEVVKKVGANLKDYGNYDYDKFHELLHRPGGSKPDAPWDLTVPVKGGPVYKLFDSFLKNIGVDKHSRDAANATKAIFTPVASILGKGPFATTGYENSGKWFPYLALPTAIYAGNRLHAVEHGRNFYNRVKADVAPTHDLRRAEQRALNKTIERETFRGNAPVAAEATTALANLDQRVNYINENSRLVSMYP